MGLAEMFLDGVLPPVAVATPALLYVWRPWRREACAGSDWAGIVAIGAAPIAAAIALEGQLPWPPVTGGQWLSLSLLAAVVFAIAAERFRLGSIAWHAGAVLLLLVVPALVLRRLIENSWQGSEIIWQLGVAGALIATLTYSLPALWSRRPGSTMPIALTLVASAAGFVLLGASSAKLGQLAGALAAGLGVCAACAIGNRSFCLGRGAALVFALAFVGLLLSGYHFAELSILVGLLVWMAPLSLWAAEIPALRSKPIVALLPCLLLLGLAGYLGAPVADPYGY